MKSSYTRRHRPARGKPSWRPILAALATLGWMALSMLFLGTSDPPTPGNAGFRPGFGLSEAFLGHLALFAGLGFLAAISAALLTRIRGLVPLLLVSLMFSAAWGIFTEVYQTTVPGRTASLEDLLVDILGAFIGGVAAWVARLYP